MLLVARGSGRHIGRCWRLARAFRFARTRTRLIVFSSLIGAAVTLVLSAGAAQTACSGRRRSRAAKPDDGRAVYAQNPRICPVAAARRALSRAGRIGRPCVVCG